jgi:hypothetical protein
MAFLGSLPKEASFACNLPIRRTCVFFYMLSQQALQLKASHVQIFCPIIMCQVHSNACVEPYSISPFFWGGGEAQVHPPIQLINLTTISMGDDYPTPLSEVLPDAFRPLLPGFLQNVSSLRVPTYGQQDRRPPRMCRVCSRY